MYRIDQTCALRIGMFDAVSRTRIARLSTTFTPVLGNLAGDFFFVREDFCLSRGFSTSGMLSVHCAALCPPDCAVSILGRSSGLCRRLSRLILLL